MTENPTTRRAVQRLGPWFHNLHLPDGSQTRPDHPLGDFPSFKWRELGAHLPADLSGWKALDLGCNAGFYSFELARRGARVTAVDVDERYLRQARWAARQYGLGRHITFRRATIYQLARTRRRWDLVLFMGLFYHLRYPLLGLDIVSRLTRRRLVFQTLTLPGDAPAEAPPDLPLDARERMLRPGWPKVAFIERELAADRTNWWAPDANAVEALLRSTGLRVLGRPAHETWICEPDRQQATSHWRWNAAEYFAATGAAPREGESR